MSELIYDKNGRLLFTKEMKEEYTILAPAMLPIHFGLLANSLRLHGYKVELLNTTHRKIVDEGLQNVHNDTCYPALLVIGQMIDALKSGKYDTHKTALMITQTGGGCRASNYIHLLRKALKKSGFDYVPVISVNLSGMERNPGFALTIPLIKKMIYSLAYGDIIMNLANQCRPYEVVPGSTDALIQHWTDILNEEYKQSKNVTEKRMEYNFGRIAKDFSELPVKKIPKVKVGVVGEIYIKYSPLGNNNLEKFLAGEGAEVVVPGIMDFMIFKADNRLVDIDLYGGSKIKYKVVTILKNFFLKVQRALIAALEPYPQFEKPSTFEELKQLVPDFLGYGVKMGEGWLLTGEMLELIHSGVNNIVCAQPFGCLPNHIVGKGMIRKIKDTYPDSNIVAIDYDPGATAINQENRIKLMLANARLAMERKVNSGKETEHTTETKDKLAGISVL